MTERREYNTEHEPYIYWLGSVPGIGSKTMSSLLEYFGDAKEVYRADEKELSAILSKKRTSALIQSRKEWDIDKEYAALSGQKIHFYPFHHPQYPKRLHALPDAPAILYCIGELPSENSHSAAIIGTRDCSPYGAFMAEQLARTFAGAGVSVISGMARGIDGIAQRAAVEARGKSYAVLGSGVLVCYPRQNRPLYDALKEQGGILSEYCPHTQPQAGFFPARNRIISGLAEAVIVIEAKEKSGTCITVDMALEQGKEVYAVPGRVGDALSAGCNKMIGQGAGIVTSPEELLQQLFGLHGQEGGETPQCSGTDVNLSPIQRRIWETMDTMPVSVSALYERMRLQDASTCPDMTRLRTELMDMALKGCIRPAGGSYFQRVFG